MLHDLIGLTFGRLPRFVRQYADLREVMSDAVKSWMNDVRDGTYPSNEESYGLPEAVDIDELKS